MKKDATTLGLILGIPLVYLGGAFVFVLMYYFPDIVRLLTW